MGKNLWIGVLFCFASFSCFGSKRFKWTEKVAENKYQEYDVVARSGNELKLGHAVLKVTTGLKKTSQDDNKYDDETSWDMQNCQYDFHVLHVREAYLADTDEGLVECYQQNWKKYRLGNRLFSTEGDALRFLNMSIALIYYR